MKRLSAYILVTCETSKKHYSSNDFNSQKDKIMNVQTPTQLQVYCANYIKSPKGKVLIAVASDDETKHLDNNKARLIVDPQKEYLPQFGIKERILQYIS